MQLIFPVSAEENTNQPGVCYVKAWPMVAPDSINVVTDYNCAITKYPFSNNSTYTTAILFTLENINSSCQVITCSTEFKSEVKYINISEY